MYIFFFLIQTIIQNLNKLLYCTDTDTIVNTILCVIIVKFIVKNKRKDY